jgi:hypothetical protein
MGGLGSEVLVPTGVPVRAIEPPSEGGRFKTELSNDDVDPSPCLSECGPLFKKGDAVAAKPETETNLVADVRRHPLLAVFGEPPLDAPFRQFWERHGLGLAQVGSTISVQGSRLAYHLDVRGYAEAQIAERVMVVNVVDLIFCGNHQNVTVLRRDEVESPRPRRRFPPEQSGGVITLGSTGRQAMDFNRRRPRIAGQRCRFGSSRSEDELRHPCRGKGSDDRPRRSVANPPPSEEDDNRDDDPQQCSLPLSHEPILRRSQPKRPTVHWPGWS